MIIKSISIIIPLYNESKRTNNLFNKIIKFISQKKINYEIIFVNDGSTDNTLEILRYYIKKIKKNNLKIINYKKNKGKGYAIKKGVLASKEKWILTLDADLSVSLNQFLYWNKKYKLKTNKVYFGSRNLKKSKVSTKYFRKLFGTVLQLILKNILHINLSDTQCGFKLYNKKYAFKIFKKLNIYDFSHDIELIYLLKKYHIDIVELPISWVYKSGSKVNLLCDSYKFIFNIFNYYYPKYKYLN